MKARASSKRRFISSLLKLTRFGNLLIIGFAQYFTAVFLVSPSTVKDVNLFLLSCSTILIAAGGYVINDYYDVKIDYINKPERVIIGRTIKRRYAILFHVILSSLGILIGIFISWRIAWGVAACNLISVFLLWLYSNNLKRLAFVGNLTVALLTGLSILIVDFFYHTGNPLILIYACFAFFMTLIREIIKDMEDLKGDNTFGCKTLPIIWGLRKTKILIYIILAVFFSVVIVLNIFYKALPLSYYFLFLFIPLILLLFKLIRADMRKDFSWLSSFCKLILLLGIVSMAFA
jgi:4-hydroxybenzoate polyprenyltransferase